METLENVDFRSGEVARVEWGGDDVFARAG